MKTTLSRFIAVLLLVVPGFMATAGFLFMKDAIFYYIADHGNELVANPAFEWMKFIGGLLLFAIGAGFIGGWVFFRDRKRNYVAPRFRKKKPRPADRPIRRGNGQAQ
ncbi:DUF2627 domain-containing protein [Paenibacillus aquistagni]|uniref:DUF2627 domain-containing protein n=1 Tax=Paenibacillus aquistagni TaxID=1852522 RepID=UPI00145A2799|nr:DUF2627 domain-containing protein [Paenibacillus aquistagni]NMM54512.1 DUF2627 domain-containing protein [Paenibacillus aquistagni]